MVEILLLALLAVVLGLIAGLLAGRRFAASDDASGDREALVAAAVDAVRQERAENMQSMLETTLSVASSRLGDQLQAGRDVLDRERQVVVEQVAGVQGELHRVTELVAGLQRDRAEQDGRLVQRLEAAAAVTSQLADTTTSLQQALASPKSRGQWGERMADDVLRMAGFVEGINYRRQTQVAGGGIPDYTFNLPKGHQVHMDVKFPIDNYLRWLEAPEADRAHHEKSFRRDVRQRVKELGDRAYIDPATTVDYLLLFIPNESVYGFLHEHDSELVDLALAQKVVLCSPTSLFAVLAVIRQAVDNFMVEQRSDQILASIGGLKEQWQKYVASVEKVGRGLSSAQAAYDDLIGPRARQFTKHLDQLDEVRAERAASGNLDAVDLADEGDGEGGRQRLALAQ